MRTYYLKTNVFLVNKMSRPKSNGLVSLHDDKTEERGFFCMDLVSLMWNDENVKGWDAWHEKFTQAKNGECPYRDRCKRYERTIKKRPVQLKLFT